MRRTEEWGSSTVLHRAAHHGLARMWKRIINRGFLTQDASTFNITIQADIRSVLNTDCPPLYGNVQSRDLKGITALHVAAACGYLAVMRNLLAGGSEIEARNEDDLTALHLSIMYENTNCVEELIAKLICRL